MTKEEYNDYIEALKARGYKFVCNSHNLVLYCYKVIEYRDDDDGDSRAVCQLLFNLYETECKLSEFAYYLIEPVVVVTRNTSERLDFTIGPPKRSIEECEHLAKEVLRWVDVNVDIK